MWGLLLIDLWCNLATHLILAQKSTRSNRVRSTKIISPHRLIG